MWFPSDLAGDVAGQRDHCQDPEPERMHHPELQRFQGRVPTSQVCCRNFCCSKDGTHMLNASGYMCCLNQVYFITPKLLLKFGQCGQLGNSVKACCGFRST